MRRVYVHDHTLQGNEHPVPGGFFQVQENGQYVFFQLPGCEVNYLKKPGTI